jgi:hypothetical protein
VGRVEGEAEGKERERRRSGRKLEGELLIGSQRDRYALVVCDFIAAEELMSMLESLDLDGLCGIA